MYKSDETFPFQEIRNSDNSYIRTFKSDLDQQDLVWHRDKEDRIIESDDSTDWLIQIDNQLPIIINKKIFIKRNTYHRLIKGSSNLVLKIVKIL